MFHIAVCLSLARSHCAYTQFCIGKIVSMAKNNSISLVEYVFLTLSMAVRCWPVVLSVSSVSLLMEMCGCATFCAPDHDIQHTFLQILAVAQLRKEIPNKNMKNE